MTDKDQTAAPAIAEQGMVALLNESEINQQVATAHRFPRSMKRFSDEAMQMVTLNQQVAEECIYTLPARKGSDDNKPISGPSTRFAEVIASAWGNCRAGARVIAEGAEMVTVQGAFHDLERNVALTVEVQRRIVNKHGKRYSPDMIAVTANAACSIALRNAILRGVPKAFWSSMFDAAQRTIRGDMKTLDKRREAAVFAFKELKVTPEMICGLLGVAGVADIGLDDLVVLRGILTAIKDGDTTVEEAFSTAGLTPMPKAKEPPPATATPAEEKHGVHGGEGATAPAKEVIADDPANNAGPIVLTGATEEPKVTHAVIVALRAALKASNVPESELLAFFDIQRIEDLPDAKMKAATKWIREQQQ